jgi:hypothetical protein
LQTPRDTVKVISHATSFPICAMHAYRNKSFDTARNSACRKRH